MCWVVFFKAMTDDPFSSLPLRRRRFVEAYLQTWNASEAARRAGFTGRPNAAGERLMCDLRIKAAIAARLKQSAMQADEVLMRLTQQASNAGAEYIREDGSIDLPGLIRDGKSHLIKGIKYNRQGKMVVEFYDAQAALALIGKAQRMFVEQVDMTQHMDQVCVYIPDNGRQADAGQVIEANNGTD